MATVAVEDDESWLYGETSGGGPKNDTESQDAPDEHENSTHHIDESSRTSRFSVDERDQNTSQPPVTTESHLRSFDDKEAGELSGEEEVVPITVSDDVPPPEDSESAVPGASDDTDSDDDSVQVTIGDIKAGPPAYGYNGPPVNLNIKRGSGYQPTVAGQAGGKGGKGVDIESAGMINGVPTYEFNLDSMEDKPWRKPGADITDYFNYGFNEETWKAYCEKQRKLRLEAAGGNPNLVVGLGTTKPHHPGKDQQIPVATVNENSKYAGGVNKKAGPPPGRKTSGSIDVIGSSTTASRRPPMLSPKENVIQVVTADKRDYSRKPFIDTSMPPPPPGIIPPGLPVGVFPPDMAMPPPGMPPPGLPPPGIPPPNMPLPGSLPNFNDPYDSYHGRNFPPPPGSTSGDRAPGYDNSYDGSYFNGNNSAGQDPYNPYEPSGEGQWDSRDGHRDRFSKKDWDYPRHSSDRSPQRSPTEEDYERRHRDYRERDRDRSRDHERERNERERGAGGERDRERDRDGERERYRERDRDRDREREREYDPEERRERDRDGERRHREHRDREDKHSSRSRRKHREDPDDEHRSSRHKRKRSKRDKDDDGGGSSSGAGPSGAGGGSESQDAAPETGEEESQQE